MSRPITSKATPAKPTSTPALTAPSAGCDEDWVDEGFRQLRLGMLWERLALALERRGGAASSLAETIHNDVLITSMKGDWLPGAGELLRKLATNWKATKHIAFSDLKVADFQSNYRSRWPGRSVVGSEIEAHRDALLKQLEGAFRDPARVELGPLPSPDLAVPTLEALDLAASARSALWIGQATALDAWSRLREAAGRRGEHDRRLIQLQRLARECCEVAAWGEEFRRGSASFPMAAVQGEALGRATEQLVACETAITEFLKSGQAAPEEENLIERRALIDRLDAVLAQVPEDWPPRVLASFQARLREIDAQNLGAILSRAKAVAIPPNSHEARLRLVAAVARAVDEASEALTSDSATRAWAEVETASARLLRHAGAAVCFARNPVATPEVFDVDERLEVGSQPLVRETAILFDPCELGRAAFVILRGRCERSKSLPEAARRLLEVMGGLAPGHREDLVRRARTLIDKMAGYRDLAGWWGERKAEVDRRSLWKLLQELASLISAEPGLANSAILALDAFADAGFRLVPMTNHSPSTGPWRVASDRPAGEAFATGSGVKLELILPGDERSISPDVCLSLPSERGGHPMVRALVGAEETLDLIRQKDPAWEGWPPYNELVWDLAYRPSGIADQLNPEIARGAFEAVYRRGQQNHPPGPQYRDLAGRLYKALEAMGEPVIPKLDEATWRPSRLKAPIADGTIVRWERSEEPFGEILEVVRFGVGSSPAEIRVSMGREVPEGVAPWLGLPEPPDCAQIPVGAVFPLRDWHRLANGLAFLARNDRAESAQAFRDRYVDWVETPLGLSWFDALVRRAIREPNGAADTWLNALASEGWCECMPPHCGGIRPAWPKGRATSEAPLVAWSWEDRVRQGEAIGGTVRYVPRLALLTGTFSLGSKVEGTLQHAEAVVEAVSADPQLERAIGPAARALHAASLDVKLGFQSEACAHDLVMPLIDHLPGCSDASPPQALERVLAGLRLWCSRQGLEVLPDWWSFTRQRTDPTLGSTGMPPSEFSASIPSEQVGLRSLGLKETRASGTIHRAPSTFVSAGKSPQGYDDLVERLGRSGLTSAHRLSLALVDWPTAAREGPDALALAAKHFFDTFWAGVGGERTEEVDPVARTLETLLADGFQLRAFRPRSIDEHPSNHIAIKVRGPGSRGKVSKVLRPGLIHDSDGLCFPANVELE